jgi:alkylated DNA repair dioxygenase AlkB
MDLFDTGVLSNKLPFDGEVYYHGPLFSAKESQEYMEEFLDDIAWENDSVKIFGKHLVLDRKVALYADETVSYTYANVRREALPWTNALRSLKALVEKRTGETFNSCLLNLYPSGKEGMGWHTDAEKEMKEHGVIASLSFGAERNFVFKHKESKRKISFLLEKGSLLVMQGVTQQYWLHSLPKTKKVQQPRINLTFRTFRNLKN